MPSGPPPKERWPPPIPDWERPTHWPPPTTYATKEEWLAACERDRQAEEQELMDLYRQHDLQILPRTG